MKDYALGEVSVIVGASIIESFNKVSVELGEESNTFTTGSTGESTRTKNANRMGTILLTMPQTSSDNKK